LKQSIRKRQKKQKKNSRKRQKRKEQHFVQDTESAVATECCLDTFARWLILDTAEATEPSQQLGWLTIATKQQASN